MERSLEKLSSMSSLPDELEQEMNNFDIFAISSLKQHVEFGNHQVWASEYLLKLYSDGKISYEQASTALRK